MENGSMVMGIGPVPDEGLFGSRVSKPSRRAIQCKDLRSLR